MSQMHVGLYAPGWPYGAVPNGIVTYVHWLREALINQGHRVTVFTHDIASTVRSGADDGVHLVRARRLVFLKRWLLRRLGKGSGIQTELAEDLRDAVLAVHRRQAISVFEMEESFGRVGALIAQRKFPVVVKLHGPAFRTLADQETPEAQRKVQAEGDALRMASFITSPSQCALDETVARYGLTPRLAVHVVNPLSLSADAALWSRQSCELETVLFVGRFELLKGADRILHAFRAVLEKRPLSRLLFVGPDNGIKAADGRLQKFKEFVAGLFTQEQQQQVIYLGPKRPEQISLLRTKAIATIIPSRWESQGYTALEAMLQGCPVICADTSGLRELVRHGVNGLLFSGDSADLAEKTLQLLGAPALAAQLGSQARIDVARVHDPATVAKQTVSVYESARAMFR